MTKDRRNDDTSGTVNRRDVMKAVGAGATLTAVGGMAGTAAATQHGNWECEDSPNQCPFEETSDDSECEYCKLDNPQVGETYTIPGTSTTIKLTSAKCITVDGSEFCDLVLKAGQDCIYFSEDADGNELCSPKFDISHITVQSNECCECDYSKVTSCLDVFSCCEVSGCVTGLEENCDVKAQLHYTDCDPSEMKTLTSESSCFEFTNDCSCTPEEVRFYEPDGTLIEHLTLNPDGELNCSLSIDDPCNG